MAKKKKVKTKEIVPVNEIKDIALRADELVDKSNVFMQITTRGADSNSLVDFKVFDETKLVKIAENMPEINRATNTFGKQNSQTTSKLMSLNMISQSPYRRLKQCLAQIERKRSALKENVFKLRKEKLEMERLLYKKEKMVEKLDSNDPDIDIVEVQFDIDELNIELQEKALMSPTTVNVGLQKLSNLGLIEPIKVDKKKPVRSLKRPGRPKKRHKLTKKGEEVYEAQTVLEEEQSK